MKIITIAETLALVAVAVGLYYGWERLASLFKSWDAGVTAWVGQAPGGIQVTGTDANGNPVGNYVPYPDPQTTAEVLANQAAAGVSHPDTGTGFEA